MSTTLPATLNGSAPPALDDQTIEKVVVGGDLSKLTAAERLAWYKARCDAAGLDVRSQPFSYLLLQGKLTLYANKGGAEQLRAARGVSVVSLSTQQVGDVYVVTCSVRDRDGRTDCATGAVPIKGLGGDALANALMKAETKAKRRATLSICGLGMLDESELETIGDARRVDPDRAEASHRAEHLANNTGHGRTGAYAPPAVVKRYQEWLAAFAAEVNGKWLDHWTDEAGQLDTRVADLLTTWRLSGHLLKWARGAGRIDAPAEPRTRQYDPLVAIAWDEDPDAVDDEARAYARRLWREAAARLAPEPEPEPAGPDPGGLVADDPPEPGPAG